jgi:hypothetical protein
VIERESLYRPKGAQVSIETRFRALREAGNIYPAGGVPRSFQGVSKDRIRQVLAYIDHETDDMVDVVYALLDDQLDSFYRNPPYNAKFCHGATTAHIGAHVGVYQRGGTTKLDREGRDYWIKPLVGLGAIEPIYLNTKTRKFDMGHPVPKSPNSGYRLAEEFVNILRASDVEWQAALKEWIGVERTRERARLQAEAQELAIQQYESDHRRLIVSCTNLYVPNFLPGFQILFVDMEDGQRVKPEEIETLREAGITLELSDAMPDLLLWNPESDLLWVIEAVTSDGEVDEHKVSQLIGLAARACYELFKARSLYFGAWREKPTPAM